MNGTKYHKEQDASKPSCAIIVQARTDVYLDYNVLSHLTTIFSQTVKYYEIIDDRPSENFQRNATHAEQFRNSI